VTISWYEGENLKSKDITVYGDPMFAYKDPNGNFLDVDGDGIYDIDEIDPVNSTRVSWYIDELERDKNDGIITEEEKEEHITNQFNPYIKEKIPPKIENIDIKTSVKIKWKYDLLVPHPVIKHCWSKIKVEISDVSEFTVTVKVKDNGKYVTFTGQGNEVFEATIDIDYWKDYLVDYRIKVVATDVAGNEIEWEKKINGLFGGLLDALSAIWDMIAGAFTAAFEMMVAALNFLVNIIIEIIQIAFEIILSTIKSAVQFLLYPIVQELGANLRHNSPISWVGTTEKLASYILTPITFLTAIFYSLMIAELVIQGMTATLSSLFGRVLEVVLPYLLMTIFGMFITTIGLMMVAETMEGVFILAEMAGAVTSSIEIDGSIMSIAAYITIWKVKGKLYLPAFALTIFGLLLALAVSSIAQELNYPGYVTYIAEIFALLFAIIGVWDLYESPDEKIAKFSAPICHAFSQALSGFALVLIPMKMANSYLTKEWVRGWAD
jgi:hypothetical protein